MADTSETNAGTPAAPLAAPPAESNPNAEAKKLPWVQDLMKASAELAEMKKAQAEAAEAAERERAEREGDYKRALELAEAKVKKVEAESAARVRQLELETEFVKAGAVDPRAVRIFEREYNPEVESIAAFVARVKGEDANAMYFRTNTRQPLTAPPVSGGATATMSPTDLEAWSKSADPEKRAKATAYAAAYFDQHGRMPPQ